MFQLESMGVKKACLDTDQAIVDGDRCSSRNSQVILHKIIFEQQLAPDDAFGRETVTKSY